MLTGPSARALDRRPRRTAATLVALALLAVLATGAPATALHADSGRVAVEDIEIAGTPRLYVEQPGRGAGYNAAWIVFRTRPHLHVARQVVAEVRGLRGRSYGGAGAPNCVRSTVIQANKLVKPGQRYRVRFYVRPGAHGTATTLLKSVTLTASRFDSSRARPSVPRC
ncbi:MAG: hypothetical protein M3376_07860 [Actinomycetota bacterium]|nr:hypothetical protein [Actinomycetota bacterium]